MIRKVLLVGCRQGPWVPVAGMGSDIGLRIQPPGTPVSVERKGSFMRASVDCSHPCEDVLVEAQG